MEFSLAEALDIMYRSGHNILKFYTMRAALSDGSPESAKLLEGMKKIIQEEIKGSRRLAEICKEDVRLGYHSEAEVYKFFPEKLLWRARCLEELLAGDVAEAEKILRSGKTLTEFIVKNDEVVVPGQVIGENGISWSVEADEDQVIVHMDFKTDSKDKENIFVLFSDAKGIRKVMETVHFSRDKGLCGGMAAVEQYETETGWHADMMIPRERFFFESSFFMGIQRQIITEKKVVVLNDKKRDDFLDDGRLNLYCYDGKKLTKVQL
jgi:hypothetical protein